MSTKGIVNGLIITAIVAVLVVCAVLSGMLVATFLQ